MTKQRRTCTSVISHAALLIRFHRAADSWFGHARIDTTLLRPMIRLPQLKQAVGSYEDQALKMLGEEQGWRSDRRAEDADAQCRHGGVGSRRVDAVPVGKDEPVGVRRRDDFPDLLPRLGGGRVTGRVDVQQPPGSYL
jgi:hypothetical protein